MARVEIASWEIFFVGARTLIGRYVSDNEISPVYELIRVPSERGIATTIFPVGWFPVDSLIAENAPSFPISKLGPAEQRQLANGVQKAEEMLQQMRAAASGIAVAKEMPK